MAVTYVLRAYDASGVSFIELLLSDGASLGYVALPVYDENGAWLFDLANSPTDDPPDGELPYHNSAGVQLGTLEFDESGVGSGYERLVSLLQSAVGRSVDEEAVNLVWEAADAELTDTLTLRTSFVPTANTLLERNSSEMRVRISGDLVLTLESQLEQGEGEAITLCDAITNFLGSVIELRTQSPRLRYSGRRNSVSGDSGERGFRWVHEFVVSLTFDYRTPRRAPVGDATRSTFKLVTIDLQTYLEDEVFSALGVVAHWGNAVPTDPSVTEVGALVRISQSSDSAGAQIQTGTRQLRRRSGVVSVELSGLSTAGASLLWRTVDELVERFSRCSRGAAVFQSPVVTGLGVGGAQASLTVSLPFYVDERLPVPALTNPTPTP